ncbi:hypothetical protein BOTCAL_0118g00130 [Botryotinia calthae]|uniref:Uncharacterized protein n=1 Tax=Botryotinia calthae TaxID=38488 RepID=A0A4Y8D4U2_9HELO|nr:hypothetical protein BOTCAL_0118g00130 [Botryotinia calthae]
MSRKVFITRQQMPPTNNPLQTLAVAVTMDLMMILRTKGDNSTMAMLPKLYQIVSARQTAKADCESFTVPSFSRISGQMGHKE